MSDHLHDTTTRAGGEGSAAAAPTRLPLPLHLYDPETGQTLAEVAAGEGGAELRLFGRSGKPAVMVCADDKGDGAVDLFNRKGEEITNLWASDTGGSLRLMFPDRDEEGGVAISAMLKATIGDGAQLAFRSFDHSWSRTFANEGAITERHEHHPLFPPAGDAGSAA